MKEGSVRNTGILVGDLIATSPADFPLDETIRRLSDAMAAIIEAKLSHEG